MPVFSPKSLGAWTLAALPIVFLSGCATTESVTEQTAPLGERIQALDSKLDSSLNQALERALRETRDARQQSLAAQDLAQATDRQVAGLTPRVTELEQAIAAHEQRLRALDQEVRVLAQARPEDSARLDDLARRGADQERQLQAMARDAQSVDQDMKQRMDRLEQRLLEVARMAEDALAALGLGPRKIFGKVVHSATLTDDKTLFPINSPDLGEKDRTKLDAVAEYVKKLDVNYHIGIHGHTDGLGSDDYNYALGKARAEVVKNYLHEKKGIPLLRMSVISHGATDVSAYREGANRRIVVEVLQ